MTSTFLNWGQNVPKNGLVGSNTLIYYLDSQLKT